MKIAKRSSAENLMMFFRAADEGDVESLARYLPHVDPKARWSPYRRSALHVAVAGGHVECVKMLLPVSDPLAAEDDGRMTPAATAAAREDTQILRLILDQAPEAGQGDLGREALTYALLAHSVGCSRMLLIAGCGLGLDRGGQGPLHRAVFGSQTALGSHLRPASLDCLREVLAHADLALIDARGLTALQYARKNEAVAAAEIIEAFVLAEQEKSLLSGSIPMPGVAGASTPRPRSL